MTNSVSATCHARVFYIVLCTKCFSQDDSKRNCLTNILDTILCLQEKKDSCCEEGGCDKPYLGPITTSVCYNTRPIMLYNCCTGNPWSFTATVNSESVTSNIFRVENCDDCCCTCRILYPNTTNDGYVSTNQFFTLDLNCVGALQCLADTYVELC